MFSQRSNRLRKGKFGNFESLERREMQCASMSQAFPPVAPGEFVQAAPQSPAKSGTALGLLLAAGTLSAEQDQPRVSTADIQAIDQLFLELGRSSNVNLTSPLFLVPPRITFCEVEHVY
jgi:hypothetical protein